MSGVRLSVSIVVFRPDQKLLGATLACLSRAGASLGKVALYVVDNGGSPGSACLESFFDIRQMPLTVLSGHGNVGYGRGHNLAIERLDSQYHLVLNPDVELAPDALARALDFLDAHPCVGLLTPYIADERGEHQFLCRRYPTVPDLFIRGFLPAKLRQRFARRLARYEMRDVINGRDVVWDPPVVSGCFMLFRTDALRRLGGFDPRYFLYFEDYDLSLRAHDLARVAYVPSVRVMHHGGGASRKGWKHVRMFVVSAGRFFFRFGWRWF
jgi:GT2 family glycosyltransferase